MRSSTNNTRFDSLEAMRGFAAIWVVFYHANNATTAFIGPLTSVPAISNGYLGVDFFFVLSGFVIAFSSAKLAEAGDGVGAYLRARLIRIYVPYLPVGIGMFLLYLMLPTLSAADRSPGLVTSLTLLPSNSPPALSVAWTLVHEMIFYCIYAAFFVNRKALYAALCGWAVAIACLHFSGAALSRVQEYFFSPLNLCFLLGVMVFHIRRIQAPPCVALGLGAVGVALVGFVANTTDPNRTVSALGFALLVLAGTSVRDPQAKVPRPLVALGAASYAIYLIHNPFISLFVRGVRVATPSLDTWGAFAAISCAAIVAGGAYWAFYERKALRWVRARVPNSALKVADKVGE